MCLAIIAKDPNPKQKLVIALNRDEFFARETQPLHLWPGGLAAGKDMVGGGTWFGVTTTGRLAILTNFRDFALRQHQMKSRGDLPVEFLRSSEDSLQFAKNFLEPNAKLYNPYNFVFGEIFGDLFYFSNHPKASGPAQKLASKFFGVSNGPLVDIWPKTLASVKKIKSLPAPLGERELLNIMQNREFYPQDALPDTGVGKDMERMLSSAFINMPEKGYGTRTTTVLIVETTGQTRMFETNYGVDAKPTPTTILKFQIQK